MEWIMEFLTYSSHHHAQAPLGHLFPLFRYISSHVISDRK